MKPPRKPRRIPGNTLAAPADNHTPLTLHEIMKPSGRGRVSNTGASLKPTREDVVGDESVRKSAGAPLSVNPRSPNRGPGRRQKRAKIGRS